MIPQVSIIVPVYNARAYLPQCLASIQAQTFPDWECILVDDGSSDGSGDICDEISLRDARFRAIHQPNAGVSRARNAGIEAARGEHLFFCDADDAAHPLLLELALAQQKKDRDALVAWRHTSDRALWEQPSFGAGPFDVTDYPKRALLSCFYAGSFLNPPWNKLFSRKLVRDHGLRFDARLSYGEDLRFCMDYLRAWFSVCPQAHLCMLELPLYYYELGNSFSLTHAHQQSADRDFTGYCAAQLEQYARRRDVFAPLDQYPAADLLPIMTEPLNTIAYGLTKAPHPRQEIKALWDIPELREISRWHREHRVFNVHLFFLRLHWAGGVKWWHRVHEKRPDLFSLVYHLGYRSILRP